MIEDQIPRGAKWRMATEAERAELPGVETVPVHALHDIEVVTDGSVRGVRLDGRPLVVPEYDTIEVSQQGGVLVARISVFVENIRTVSE